jgi:hypothetical protein
MIKQCIDPKQIERSLFVSMLQHSSNVRSSSFQEYAHNQHADSSNRSNYENCALQKHQLEIAERIVIIQKKAMLDMLSSFRAESGELRKLKEERNSEQYTINKLIKKEVIDMADRMEAMHEQINF